MVCHTVRRVIVSELNFVDCRRNCPHERPSGGKNLSGLSLSNPCIVLLAYTYVCQLYHGWMIRLSPSLSGLSK